MTVARQKFTSRRIWNSQMGHVVHISPSALAGAPGMLSEALNDFDHVDSSVHFRAGDYGNHRDIFSPESLPLSVSTGDRDLFMHHFENADVVHVHNFIPKFILNWMSQAKKRDVKYIYQVHSPRYERPIFDDLSDFHGIHFSHKLVICHFHPRHFPNFRIVPNCLYRKAFLKSPVISSNEVLTVQFSPSGRSNGRWASKSNPMFDQVIQLLKDNSDFSVDVFEGISPQNLAHRRSQADITIDELVTGSYHLVSYEGMAAGTIVLNNADSFSIGAFQIGFQSPPPPFIKCSPVGLYETLIEINRDRDRLLEHRKLSRKFFEDWMTPYKTSKIFASIYGI